MGEKTIAPILKKNVYSIETEISSDYYEKQNFDIDYHEESSRIYELILLHNCEEGYIKKISEEIIGHYSDRKPIGSDGYISGGWHLHIFDSELLDAIEKIPLNEMKFMLLNNPFWINYSNGRGILRKISSRASFNISGDEYPENTKSLAFGFKTEYYSHAQELGDRLVEEEIGERSFEFRMNDVIDGRVYYLYKALILAKLEGLKFKRTSDTFRNFLKEGIVRYYSDKVDELNEIELKKISKDGYILTEEDKKTITENLNKLYAFAKKDGRFTDLERWYIETYANDIIKKINEEYRLTDIYNLSFELGKYRYNFVVQIKESTFNKKEFEEENKDILIKIKERLDEEKEDINKIIKGKFLYNNIKNVIYYNILHLIEEIEIKEKVKIKIVN